MAGNERLGARQLTVLIVRELLKLSEATEHFYRTLGAQDAADDLKRRRQEKQRCLEGRGVSPTSRN